MGHLSVEKWLIKQTTTPLPLVLLVQARPAAVRPASTSSIK